VEVAGGVKDDLKQEIADDLVAVVTAFSQKIYK
jgi:predicted site-specific integrase-resolvase